MSEISEGTAWGSNVSYMFPVEDYSFLEIVNGITLYGIDRESPLSRERYLELFGVPLDADLSMCDLCDEQKVLLVGLLLCKERLLHIESMIFKEGDDYKEGIEKKYILTSLITAFENVLLTSIQITASIFTPANLFIVKPFTVICEERDPSDGLVVTLVYSDDRSFHGIWDLTLEN